MQLQRSWRTSLTDGTVLSPALGIGAFAVASGLMVNSQELKLVKSTREASAASGLLGRVVLGVDDLGHAGVEERLDARAGAALDRKSVV